MFDGARPALMASGNLLHAVQRAAGLEPADLLLVERVVQLDALGLAVGVRDLALERSARRKAVQAQDGDLVGRLDLRIESGHSEWLNRVQRCKHHHTTPHPPPVHSPCRSRTDWRTSAAAYPASSGSSRGCAQTT